MSDEELLDEISDLAFDKLTEADDRLENLEDPYKTVAIVYAAQGIIDNGGLEYFFGCVWPNNPSYSIFADAYEQIGRVEAAKALRDAAGSFGFPNPERDVDARRAFIEGNSGSHTVLEGNSGSHTVLDLFSRICIIRLWIRM